MPSLYSKLCKSKSLQDQSLGDLTMNNQEPAPSSLRASIIAFLLFRANISWCSNTGMRRGVAYGLHGSRGTSNTTPILTPHTNCSSCFESSHFNFSPCCWSCKAMWLKSCVNLPGESILLRACHDLDRVRRLKQSPLLLSPFPYPVFKGHLSM